MDTRPRSSTYERFSTRQDVGSALDTISNNAHLLHHTMNNGVSRHYDGLIVFSHRAGDKTAVPVAHADSAPALSERHRFRDEVILGRSLRLGHTALGKVLAARSYPAFNTSELNPEPQFTYTQRLVHEGHQVGAVQYSFTPEGPHDSFDDLPTLHAMHRVLEESAEPLATISAELARLQLIRHDMGSLATALEFDAPIAPNAFVVRWDVEASKHHMHHPKSRTALKTFINSIHPAIRALAKEYQGQFGTSQFSVEHIYDDQGDGANVILAIPDYINTYDSTVRSHFRKDTAEPFMHDIRREIDRIGAYYQHDLQPLVHVDGTFGSVEPNSIGRYTATEMFTLADKKRK